jgi:hypothetical protein
VDRQVQIVDVLPTILRALGLPSPPEPRIVGRPLEESFVAAAAERPAPLETKSRDFVLYGVRTRRDKYVRELYPASRELYFDLLHDPGESVNRLAEAGPRAQEMKRIAEAAVGPAALRHELRVAGADRYELRVRTSGWIESVETVGLGPSERAEVEGDRRAVTLSLAPQPGRPRDVTILTRPHGVPLWIEGTRGGRRLRPTDIRVGAQGVSAATVPFRFPEPEEVPGIFSPPRAAEQGIAAWVAPLAGAEVPRFDNEARERLKALGYIR